MLFFHVCNAFIIADWLSGERYWLWATASTGTKERKMEDMSCYRQVICMCLKEYVHSLPCKVLFILRMLLVGVCISWMRAVLLQCLKLIFVTRSGMYNKMMWMVHVSTWPVNARKIHTWNFIWKKIGSDLFISIDLSIFKKLLIWHIITQHTHTTKERKKKNFSHDESLNLL